MLSLDWKERLKLDAIDFFERKIPEQDYDIDLVYNAYPIRVDNQVPSEVISHVAKILVSKLSSQSKNYIDFYNYIWEKKGNNGKQILVTILSKVINKDKHFFMEYISGLLEKETDTTAINLLFNKTLYSFYKKGEIEHVDYLITWLYSSNELLSQSAEKFVTKLCKSNSDYVSLIFKKLEKTWMTVNDHQKKINIQFLKHIGKIDRDFYLSVFRNYKVTRNPIFVEILSGSIFFYDDLIAGMVDKWCLSGNVRVKKVALLANKVLKKKKKG